MKTFKLLFACILSVCLFSCSSETDSDVPGEPSVPDEIPEFSITAAKHEVGLFEGSWLHLTTSAYEGNVARLASYYDSIVWKIDDVYKFVSTNRRFLLSKEQVFAAPGKYQVKATGYKDNEIVNESLVDIQANGPKDFIGIDWANTKDVRYVTFINTINDYSLNLFYFSTPHPHALLNYIYDRIIDDADWDIRVKASRYWLYDYITGLYGESVCSYEGDNISNSPLGDEYRTRFEEPLTVYERAVAIWETSSTHIALIGVTSDTCPERSTRYFRVIAEPRY